MEPKTRRLIYIFILPLAVLVLLLYLAVETYRPSYLLQLDFLDVGQGDSIFIQTAEGNQILMDGGPDSSVLSELGKVMPFHDRSLDLIVLTHPDADHVSGLVEVLKRFKVKKALITGFETESAVYSEFKRLLENKNVEVITVRQGHRVWLDSSTVFDVYWPGVDVSDTDLASNDTSIYGKLTFGTAKVLFTGDAASRVEDGILPMFNLDADLLKVGHHGSKSSTSKQLLDEVTPEYSVIQVGEDNSYNHPAPEVLTILENSGTDILRNDLEGLIRFVSDGASLYQVDKYQVGR